MDDEAFLGYVEIHSETERHLFSLEHVRRLLTLAGRDTSAFDCGYPAFLGIDQWTAKPLVQAARERRKSRSSA